MWAEVMAVEDVGNLGTQEAWFSVETGDRPWTCPRWEDGIEASAHLGFLKGYGSWGESYLLSKGDGKHMVCSVLDKKALPREFSTAVCLLISSGFKFTLPMWSRKP